MSRSELKKIARWVAIAVAVFFLMYCQMLGVARRDYIGAPDEPAQYP